MNTAGGGGGTAPGHPPPSVFAGQQPSTGGIYKAMEPLLCKHDKGGTMKSWLKLQRDALAGSADIHRKFWGELLGQPDLVVMGVLAEGSQ